MFVCFWCWFTIRQVRILIDEYFDGGVVLHFFFLVWYVFERVLLLMSGGGKDPEAEVLLKTRGISCRASSSTGKENLLTVTFHPLMDKSIQQGATMITEGGASIGVDFELVLASGVLVGGEEAHCLFHHQRNTFLDKAKVGSHHFLLVPCPRFSMRLYAILCGNTAGGGAGGDFIVSCFNRLPILDHIVNAHVSFLYRV